MTHDEIAKLDAAQLRLAIAEEYGWKDMQMVYPEDPEYYAWHAEKWVRVPDWPRDIAAAWDLVEEVRAAGGAIYIDCLEDWRCLIEHNYEYYDYTDPSALIAICRAWLMWKQT